MGCSSSIKLCPKSKKDNDWPYKHRRSLIKSIRDLAMVDDRNTLPGVAQKLRDTFGMDIPPDEDDERPDLNFIIDTTSEDIMYQITRLVNVRPSAWQKELDHLCTRLATHISPPVHSAMGTVPAIEAIDLEQLQLTGIDLGKAATWHTLKTLIANNPGLKTIELAFTGLDNKHMREILPDLAALKKLTYLGLRGNRLDATLVPHIVKMVEEGEFPKMMWLDLQNNVNIFILRRTFLKQMKGHWPSNGYQPSFTELANGKAIVLEEAMDMNF